MIFDLIIIGGGAAGFFGAIQSASSKPGQSILILERTSKLLSKVRISGGGRCNVTHECFNPFELARHYPRGEKPLKKLFKHFDAVNVIEWFKHRGVALKTERDGRMFPVTDNSETIINCFMEEARRLNIKIETNKAVQKIEQSADSFSIHTATHETYRTKKILVATGGNPNATAYSWIMDLGHKIVQPIPSLFTFNDSNDVFKDLMGISVPAALIKVRGTKFAGRGPLLITHWGLSGPVVIKLSAWAAEHLNKCNYSFDVQVNWIGMNEDLCREQLMENKPNAPKQKIHLNTMFGVPLRLWQRLCERAEILPSMPWHEASNKDINKLVENLVHTIFHIRGKTTFREEFVTCGGIDLSEIHLDSMQSKLIKGLYFAGEVLNIDGETGGFNFQAAWTTAYVAARSISEG